VLIEREFEVALVYVNDVGETRPLGLELTEVDTYAVNLAFNPAPKICANGIGISVLPNGVVKEGRETS
jgi:hypothetical protein